MNNRYQRFIDKRKQEGKKRRSLWCTDQEWSVLRHLSKSVEILGHCLDIQVYDLCMVVDSEFNEVPQYTIVRVDGISIYDKHKLVFFNYNGKAYVHSLHKLRKVILKGIWVP